jgi:polysaccharide export outer membrane protein
MAKRSRLFRLALLLAIVTSTLAVSPANAQTAEAEQSATTPDTTGVALPVEYLIGPEDVLGIVFWREPDMSGDVTVRPDGRITLPVIGEISAAGLHPQALQKQILAAAGKYISDPNVAVVVRQINSRKVFITGRVTNPGPYPLQGPRTVMQLIALAGGLTEYADSKNITIMRNAADGPKSFKFNYKDVAKGKNLEQNILLKPGDTVVVP